MVNIGRFLAMGLLFFSVSCGTTRTVSKSAPPLPPAVQQAQNEVWGLEFQLAEAQHDLTVLRINHQEADVQSRMAQAQQHNNAAQISQLSQELQQLQMRQAHEDNKMSLKRSWLSAVQSGDMDLARSPQEEINHLPLVIE